MAFREKLHAIQQQFEREKFDSDIQFKRESLELGRFYMQEETKERLSNTKKIKEFEVFIRQCWPLNYKIKTIQGYAETSQKILVILSQSNDSKIGEEEYHNTCMYLSNYSGYIPDMEILCDAWNFSDSSRNFNYGSLAKNMNIHYIMQGIPTVVITPKKRNGALCFDTSIWNYNRGLGSFFNHTMFSMPYNDEYDKLRDKIRLAQLAITGIVRDNFMMIEFHKPARLPLLLQQEQNKLKGFPELKQFLTVQYQDMGNCISTPQYRELCAGNEWDTMQESITESVKSLTSNK
jgi:hypothetical protein